MSYRKDSFAIRIAGDSGDGIQLVGDILSKALAESHMYISTIPDYPSEVRAPSGTVEGVSSIGILYSTKENIAPPEFADVVFSTNPASLVASEKCIGNKTTVIIDESLVNDEMLDKAGIDNLGFDSICKKADKVLYVDVNKVILESDGLILNKSKNFIMLGILSSGLGIDIELIKNDVKLKFFSNESILNSNLLALEKGYGIGKELGCAYMPLQESLGKGEYRILTGNEQIAYSLIEVSKRLGKKLYFSGYPITPATEIMQTLSKYRRDDIVVFQAEDEIAAVASAIGASFAGSLSVTATSGPGFSLKSEAINLAVMAELPVIIIDVQRAGPSTGMPTKTEQGDLLQALFGRHGESPIVVAALPSNSDSYKMLELLSKMSIKYMTPVVLLSDAYLAHNSSLFSISDLKDSKIVISENQTNRVRDPETMAFPWIAAGTKGAEVMIGGLERDYETGKVSYDQANHEKMVKLREEKIRRISLELPKAELFGKQEGEVLIITWGSLSETGKLATIMLNDSGIDTASLNLDFISPLQPGLEDIFSKFEKIFVAEENMGQLKFVLESKFKNKFIGINKVTGQKMTPEFIFSVISDYKNGRK